MEEVVKDLYDEYIEELRVFYKDQEAAFPRIPHSLLKEKEVVSTYIKDDLSDLVDCEYDQILHHLLKDSTKHHIFVRLFHDKDIFDFDYNVKDKAGNTLLMNFISAYFPQMVEKNRKLSFKYEKLRFEVEDLRYQNKILQKKVDEVDILIEKAV